MTDTDSHRLAYAAALGIEGAQVLPLDELLVAIEQRLGERAAEQRVSWFLLSMARHLNLPIAPEFVDGEPRDEIVALARTFMADAARLKALEAVLRDGRLRYTLLTFAKKRDPVARVVSTETSLFRRARDFLEAAVAGEAPVVPAPDASIVERRAARRGFDPAVTHAGQGGPVARDKWKETADGDGGDEPLPAPLSEEQLDALEQALDSGGASDVGHQGKYRTDEAQLSLVLGLLTGFGVVGLVLWLFF